MKENSLIVMCKKWNNVKIGASVKCNFNNMKYASKPDIRCKNMIINKIKNE